MVDDTRQARESSPFPKNSVEGDFSHPHHHRLSYNPVSVHPLMSTGLNGSPSVVPAYYSMYPNTTHPLAHGLHAIPGGVAPVMASSLPITENNPAPTFSGHGVLKQTLAERLTRDMHHLYQTKLLLTADQIERRQRVISRIEAILKAEWPEQDIKIQLFGSLANDLATQSSDVDVCLLTSWDGLNDLAVLGKVLMKHHMEHVFWIPTARVPIVRFFDPICLVSCDININQTMAFNNTAMIRSVVRLDPRIRLLTLVVKHWTKQRVINDAGSGSTLSPYTWVNLVFGFLQTRVPAILPSLEYFYHQQKGSQAGQGSTTTPNNHSSSSSSSSSKPNLLEVDFSAIKFDSSANTQSIGQLLIEFFRFFCFEYDYEDSVISIRKGRILTKKHKKWNVGFNRLRLCVEDAFETDSNIAKTADEYSLKGLREEFKRGFRVLAAEGSLERLCESFASPSQDPQFLNGPSLKRGDMPPPRRPSAPEFYYAPTARFADPSSGLDSDGSLTLLANGSDPSSPVPNHEQGFASHPHMVFVNQLQAAPPLAAMVSMAPTFSERAFALPVDRQRPPLLTAESKHPSFEKENSRDSKLSCAKADCACQDTAEAGLMRRKGGKKTVLWTNAPMHSTHSVHSVHTKH